MGAKEVRVGFVGAGAMGGAIARGLVDSGTLDAAHLAVADPAASVMSAFDALGVATYADAVRMLGEFAPDVVVLAVKPQVLGEVAPSFADLVAGRLVVSIAAGVRLGSLEALMVSSRVVRCMPNLPMAVGSGAVAIAAGTRATANDVTLVHELMSSLGVAEVMSEAQLDAAGVVCGCAPAFFALFVDCLTRAGIEAGLPAARCRAMVESTMRGTAAQLLESGEHPRAYLERVSSPGGTTIVALRELEAPVFGALTDAVAAALRRTAELAASTGERS